MRSGAENVALSAQGSGSTGSRAGEVGGWRSDRAGRWNGGRGRDRTADFLGVNEALCQLSYAPTDLGSELS